MMDASRETTASSRHNRIHLQVNSERLREYEQGLLKVKTDGVPDEDGERDQSYLNQEPITVAMDLQRKN